MCVVTQKYMCLLFQAIFRRRLHVTKLKYRVVAIYIADCRYFFQYKNRPIILRFNYGLALIL